MRYTGGGLGCKEERDIREGNLPNKGLNVFPLRERKINSVKSCVKSRIFIYKKQIFVQTRGQHYS